jgi:F-type H+-transporting ATPase subunit a
MNSNSNIQFNPDIVTVGSIGPIEINQTIALTWLVMALLVVFSWLVTRNMTASLKPTHWQMMLESLVLTINDQIASISRSDPKPVLPFAGTLFVLILTSNLLAIVPGFRSPTGSLSTTTALALAVFIAVPIFGVHRDGGVKFLKRYIEPTPLMLPFNIIGDLSRTVALAVRLYGNVMSGAVIAAILLTLTPFFFPIVMQLLGLITGAIQAWIFSVLATVYIASANSTTKGTSNER